MAAPSRTAGGVFPATSRAPSLYQSGARLAPLANQQIRLSLGGLVFLLSAEGVPLVHEADAAYRPFLLSTGAAPPARETIRVRFEISPHPSFEGVAILESTATWSILARDGERAFVFRHPSEAEPAWVARFRPGSAEVSVTCSPRFLEKVDGTTVLRCSHFGYPLDQILTMYLLGNRGILLHAAGAVIHGRGMAFSGVSGAGKSTLTGLAAGRRGWEPLSDDRVIVRVGETPPTLWGTPWSGEGQVAEHRSGEMAWLLFLEQGATHEIRPLTPGQALPRLFQTASLPWYDAEYLQETLAACGRIVQAVPTGVLSFRPEIGAIEAVERLLGLQGSTTPRP